MGLSIHSDISLIADDIIQKFYNRPLNEKEAKSLEVECRRQYGKHYFHRIAHGGEHVSRVALWVRAFARLYHELGQEVSEKDIKLLVIAGLMHDSARQGEEVDYWDSESAINCYCYLTDVLGVEKEKASRIAETIHNKDKEAFEYQHLMECKDGGIVFIDEPQVSKPLFAKIIHDADCLDVIRARTHFHVDRLDIFKDIPKSDPVWAHQLFKLRDQAMQLIHDQGDHYGELDLKKKASYHNDERGCFSAIQAEVLETEDYPLLRTLVDADYRKMRMSNMREHVPTAENMDIKAGRMFVHSINRPYKDYGQGVTIDYVASHLASEEGMAMPSLSLMNAAPYGPVNILLTGLDNRDMLLSGEGDLGVGHFHQTSSDPLVFKKEMMLKRINVRLSKEGKLPVTPGQFARYCASSDPVEIASFQERVGMQTIQEIRKQLDFGHAGNELGDHSFYHAEFVARKINSKHVAGFMYCTDTDDKHMLPENLMRLTALLFRERYIEKMAAEGKEVSPPFYRFNGVTHTLEEEVLNEDAILDEVTKVFSEGEAERPMTLFFTSTLYADVPYRDIDDEYIPEPPPAPEPMPEPEPEIFTGGDHLCTVSPSFSSLSDLSSFPSDETCGCRFLPRRPDSINEQLAREADVLNRQFFCHPYDPSSPLALIEHFKAYLPVDFDFEGYLQAARIRYAKKWLTDTKPLEAIFDEELLFNIEVVKRWSDRNLDAGLHNYFKPFRDKLLESCRPASSDYEQAVLYAKDKLRVIGSSVFGNSYRQISDFSSNVKKLFGAIPVELIELFTEAANRIDISGVATLKPIEGNPLFQPLVDRVNAKIAPSTQPFRDNNVVAGAGCPAGEVEFKIS